MAFHVRKTEHNGAKHGRGALWGTKYEAKPESGKVRRRNNKREIREKPQDDLLIPSADELLAELHKKKYRITKAIAASTDEFQTGRYEGPED